MNRKLQTIGLLFIERIVIYFPKGINMFYNYEYYIEDNIYRFSDPLFGFQKFVDDLHYHLEMNRS